jgi:hypothetical protein
VRRESLPLHPPARTRRSSGGLLDTAGTTCRRCFVSVVHASGAHAPCGQSEISFTLTAQEQRCIFAERYYYRASFRPSRLQRRYGL